MAARHTMGTADRILDTAEGLVQVRGFNAFSYADISKALGIRKASLHHHFPTKAALGLALLARYRQVFRGALADIESASGDGFAQLKRYAELYGSVLRKNRMCMCGMLAADVATLPKGMGESVAAFFAENEVWLTRVLDRGRAAGSLEFQGTAATVAASLVSSFEGAMLLARVSGGADHFDSVARQVIGNVRPRKAKPKRRRTRPPS